MKKYIYSLSLCVISFAYGRPFPIQFSVSETKIVKEIPHKDKDFATIVPGQLHTYIFQEEEDYYRDYQRSYYGITCRKGGWDCMRHYEILANGCIPYFLDLDHCPANTMVFLPKDLIWEAMTLEGVSYGVIDHTRFNYKRYYEILDQLLEHTRSYLSARAMAQYMLDTVNYKGTGTILFLSNDPMPDYIKTCMLIGFKELLQGRVLDFPKNDYIYTNYTGNPRDLYGKGFTYTKIVEDYPVDRENIEERIKNKEFDLVIYSHTHYGTLFHDLVLQHYSPDQIIYIDGEDTHDCPYLHLHNFFLREYYF